MTEKITKIHKLLLVVFGIILTLVVLESGLRIAGAIFLNTQEKRNRPELIKTNKDIYRILCLGESTTMFGGDDSYPRQLERILNAKSKTKKFHVINKGMPGANSAVIVSNIRDYLETYKPKIAVVMMGVNDGTNEDGSTPIYDETFQIRAKLFMQDFRVYKLIKLIYVHVNSRISEVMQKINTEDRVIEADLKKAIKKNSKDQWAYHSLMEYYFKENRFQEAENIFHKAIRKRPGKEWPYSGLVECFIRQSKFSEAEEILKQAISRNPSKTFGYKGLSDLYFKIEKYTEAENLLKDAIRKYPDNSEIYSLLGVHYRNVKEYQKAEESFHKAIEIRQGDYHLSQELGICYGEQGKYELMEKMFDKFLNVKESPLKLSNWYLERGEFERAEAYLKKVLDIRPEYVLVYTKGLANVYSRWGKNDLRDYYLNKANELHMQQNMTATEANYRKLAEIVQNAGVQLISMQYPLRDVQLLKNKLNSFSDIIFVSNEDNFRKVLAREPSEEYFIDSFAGDFGHCAPKGNRLIAENVAEAIMKLQYK